MQQSLVKVEWQSQTYWHELITLILGGLREKDCKFKTSLGYYKASLRLSQTVSKINKQNQKKRRKGSAGKGKGDCF